MLSLRILRWILGYVCFSIEKGSAERFLNQCARSGISIWNIYSKDGSYGACIYADSYRSLLHCAHKAGVVLRVRSRHGFPFRTAAIRRRKGLVYGTILFIGILSLLSMHYWSINIAGNLSIPAEKIEAKLTEFGVIPGILKKDVDSQLLQQKLMGAFPEVRWLSVNTNGCNITVQLEESIKKPDVNAAKRPCNVKASATGQILYMEVYDGTPEVKQGDAVVQGQLLINAVVEDAFGGSTLKHAAGKVIASTNHTFTAQESLIRTEIIPTGKNVFRRSVSVLGLRMPLTVSSIPDGEWRLDAGLQKIRVCGSFLPVSLYTELWSEEIRKTVAVSQKEALAKAKKQVQEQQKQLKDMKILFATENIKIEGKKLLYTVQANCEENITVENELFVNP